MCLTCDVKVVQELARLQGRFKYLPSFLLRATIRGDRPPEKSVSASRTCEHRRENNKDPRGEERERKREIERRDGEPYIGESEAGSECNTRGDVTGPSIFVSRIST